MESEHLDIRTVATGCGRGKEGCSQPKHCESIGECFYTGSPFVQPKRNNSSSEAVNHPPHYGGENNPYEVIKVLYAWGFDKSFCLGNAIKYIARHQHKSRALEDLKKARWYLDEHIKQMED